MVTMAATIVAPASTSTTTTTTSVARSFGNNSTRAAARSACHAAAEKQFGRELMGMGSSYIRGEKKNWVLLSGSGDGEGGDHGIFFTGRGYRWLAGFVPLLKNTKGKKKRLKCVSMAVDYYAALGVSKSASKQEIKSAYRKLARKVNE
jgi:DnaJ-domain-containing protein 1